MSDEVKPTQLLDTKASETIASVKVESLAPVVKEADRQQSLTELRSRTPDAIEKPVGGEATGLFAGAVHSYVCDQIRFADQKAAFLFAAVAAMLAFLHGKGITKLWLKNFETWQFAEGLAFLAVIGLIAGAIASAVVVLPRLQGAAGGLIFWKAIAAHESAENFSGRVFAQEPRDFIVARLHHCHELSRVCRSKYRFVAWAMWTGGIGLLASLLHLALF